MAILSGQMASATKVTPAQVKSARARWRKSLSPADFYLYEALVAAAVTNFLVKHKLGYDAAVYTQDKWRLRGEKYGNGAIVTITSEGDLYSWAFDEGFVEPLQKFLDTLGLWYDQGYGWTFHLYEADDTGEPPEGTQFRMLYGESDG